MPARTGLSSMYRQQMRKYLSLSIGAARSLPQRPGAFVERVDVAHIPAAQRLHDTRQAVGCLRRRQQVHVVRYQHVGVNHAAIFSRRLGEPVAVARIIVVIEEDRLAIIAALDHVQRLLRQEITPQAWHCRLPDH